jgi:glutathione S-transferase
MLTLSGAPFSYEHVNLLEGEHKQPDYLVKNRFGQVPCLVVGRLKLCQSAAILEYLADALGKFHGRSAEERVRIREWLFWDFDRLSPPIYRARAIKRGFRQGTPEILAMHETEARAAPGTLDARLVDLRFLVGKRPTIADIDCYGAVHYAPEAGVDLKPYPNVAAWVERVQKLKGFGAPEQVLPMESRA